MTEDEMVARYLPEAEAIIRGLIRDSERDSGDGVWCPQYHSEERCFAAIQCGECRLRLLATSGQPQGDTDA